MGDVLHRDQQARRRNHTVEAWSAMIWSLSGKRRVYTDPAPALGRRYRIAVCRAAGRVLLPVHRTRASYVSTKVFRSKTRSSGHQPTRLPNCGHTRQKSFVTSTARVYQPLRIDRGGVYLAPLIWDDGLDNAIHQ